MKIEDFPEFKHLNQQVKGFKTILKINKALRLFGLGSKKLEEMKKDLNSISTKLHEHQEYTGKFNKYFSKEGWIVHDSMNFEIIKKAVQVFENGQIDDAQKILISNFSPEEIEARLFMLKQSEEIRIRYKFIEFALTDYKAKRYYAAVPLLLMIIDGIVNDVVGKGFHAETDDLDVWGAITNVDGGIYTIKNIFKKGRQKTRTEEIDLPYRNGILHGLDLGYDNLVVTAKCWCFLFVVKDWISSKKSESTRKKKFEEETRIPSLKKVVQGIRNNEEAKKEIANWKPRIIASSYIEKINKLKTANEEEPESNVLLFLEYWKNKNFGKMAELFPSRFSTTNKRRPGELRHLFSYVLPKFYLITEISDNAPAVTEVKAEITTDQNEIKIYKFRLIYEDLNGGGLVRGYKSGMWNIISVNQ